MQNQGTTEQFLYDATETKLQEARLLLNNGFPQGAYYIGGYAVEFAFKALICRKLGFPFFVSKPGGSDESKGDYRSAVTKAFQTHDLGALLIFSGLYPKYKAEKDSQEGRALFSAWSSVSGWNENRRYEPLACDVETVDKFITSLEVIVAWIRSHY